jgi:hypothetical protein
MSIFHLAILGHDALVPATSTAGTVIRGVLFLFALLGAAFWVHDRSTLNAKQRSSEDRIRSQGRIAERLGPIVLYADPPKLWGPITYDPTGPGRDWAITSEVTASVEAAGSISVTRGRNLAAKAAGGALFPGGVFLFGNARETVHDFRELYLILEGPDWGHTWQVDPNQGEEARRFAQAVNVMARKTASSG